MVDILMATYNGEKYIKNQIESILNQTYKDWILYIRDDGSKDNTKEIIKNFSNEYPNKIVFIEDEKRGLGAKSNFAELLKYSKSEYCMFCDQDDVWLDSKIDKTLLKMKESEKQYGKSTPILLHTDLLVVNDNLEVISKSFFKYQNLNPNLTSINYLLVQNNVTGCTMMINNSLKKLSIDIPGECIMHDWWIALVASAKGKIIFLNESTIKYRQHENNEVGAQNYKSINNIIRKAKNMKNNLKSIDNGIRQAKCFYNIFNDTLSESQYNCIKEYSTIKSNSFIKRKIIVNRYRFKKSGFLRNIVYYIFI